MNFKILKRARVSVALLFLSLIAVVFLDFRDSFGAAFYDWAVSLQFVPSLLKTISVPGTLAIGLAVVLILTALFGRIYCSAICPLGIFQDIVARISKRFNKKSRYKFHKAWTIVRYTILVITIVFAVLGSITFVTLLDPYSLFGRISSYVFKPAIVFINNISAQGLSKAGIYTFLYRYELQPVHMGIMLATLIFLVLILAMSFRRGRLYCNSICPVGTFLGLISKFSLFKIELDKSSCTRCGKCARVCKAECIEIKNREIDHSRCVACYNCLTVCTEDAARYRIKKKGPKIDVAKMKMADHAEAKTDLNKRRFLVNGAIGTATFLGLSNHNPLFANGASSHSGETVHKEPKTSPVSPPGSKSIDHLNKVCTGCSLCISACPTKVLQPSFMEYGLIGVMQPHMDFHTGLCNFDCTLCSDICPTGAIIPLTVEAKHLTQIGRVKFIKANCIVETEGTDCGACSEHCPTKAVQMVPYGDLFIPEVNEEICIGCGACEYACPTRPYRAIYVDGNPVHQEAEKPETEKAKTDLKEDEFPF